MRPRLSPRARACASLLGAALALGACASAQTSSTPSGSTTTPEPGARPAQAAASPGGCAGSQLALAYARTEGATGHLELTLALRNVSQRACTLRGYPATRLLDGGGRMLAMHVRRGGGFFPDTRPAPRAVMLKPGATAHFGISFITNNEYARARICRTAAVAMSSAPGAASRWLRVSLRSAPRISPCGSLLVVSPVHT
jgi:hypothetical protein